MVVCMTTLERSATSMGASVLSFLEVIKQLYLRMNKLSQLKFSVGNKRIEISRSRYRRDAITQVSEIRPSHMIGQSVDVEAQQHLQVAVSECEERLTEAKRGLEVVVQEETALNRARESLIQKRMNHRKVLGDRRTLEMRLEQKQRQIVSLEREAIDLEEEERKTKRQCGVSDPLIMFPVIKLSLLPCALVGDYAQHENYVGGARDSG